MLGAALFGANLSTTFRLRKFGMTDRIPYSISFRRGGPAAGGQAAGSGPAPEIGGAEGVLVPALKKLPTKRAIGLHNLTDDALRFTLTFDNSEGEGWGGKGGGWVGWQGVGLA